MSIQTTATLHRRHEPARPPAPSGERIRRVVRAIWAAVSDRDAWTPAVDRVAKHPEFWFRIV